MRNPVIGLDKPQLLALIRSQFMLLGSLIKDPNKTRDPKAMLGDYESLPVPELQALAIQNAIKILNLLRSRSFTGSF